MSVRALIIAIEDYPAMEGGLAATLPGTMEAAVNFRRWLLDHRGVAAADIRFCAHPRHADATAGATRPEIVGEIRKLYDEGRERSEALFVYFSGHGFAFSDVDDRRMDVLVCADFTNASDSGGACIKLDELQERLRSWLGPGEHFYFIDACRNLVSRQDIDVLGLGITKPRSALGEPALHSLQSTIEGAVAAVGSEFPKHLIAGLRGTGRAKSWNYAPAGSMVVHFRSLTEYLLAKMPGQPVDPVPDGKAPGILRIIKPVEKSGCDVSVKGLPANWEARLRVVNRQEFAIHEASVGNGTVKLELPPDDYFASLEVKGAIVSPSGSVALDMFEPQPLEFAVEPMLGGAADVSFSPPKPLAPLGKLSVLMPQGTSLKLRDPSGSVAASASGNASLALACGRYEAEFRGFDGAIVERRTIEIPTKGGATADFATFKPGRTRSSILNAVNGGHLPGIAFFSEQLGPMADQDLGLWLAIVGASRILGGAGVFEKLGPLPLAEFKNVQPNGHPVYVLAGLDDPEEKLAVGISRGADVAWKMPRIVPEVGGLRELVIEAEPGPFVISWAIDGRTPVSCASVALPHRATLVTLSKDESGKLQAGQFLLPLPHLFPLFPPEIRGLIEQRAHLRDVKFLHRAWRAFRNRDDVFASGPQDGLREILHDKWIDPVGALLASYELIRRGRRNALDVVVRNLNRYFPELPDTAAITRLVTGAAPPPAGAPLFLEGAMAFEDHPGIFPLPPSRLNYRMTWTAWCGAVSPP